MPLDPIKAEALVKLIVPNAELIARVMSKERGNYVSSLRGMSMYVMRRELNASTVEIGKYFNRSHATIIYWCKYIESHKHLHHQAITFQRKYEATIHFGIDSL